MKILKLYKSLLSAASLVVDSEGLVSASVGGNPSIPFLVSGKRLVLPTKAHLEDPNWDNRVAFHPLKENILVGESAVLAKFRLAINVKFNHVLACLGQEILQMVSSNANHAKMTPDQSEVLSQIKEADDKTFTAYQSVIKAMGAGAKDKCFLDIYLKRGGVVGDKAYSRAAIVSFPLYEELRKEGTAVFGVKMRVKDKAAIKQLVEFLLPGVDQPGSFNSGSNDTIAPFIMALMQCVARLAGNINTIVDKYTNFIDAPGDYLYEDEWVEEMRNLEPYLPDIRYIPMQVGNDKPAPAEAVPTLQNVQPAVNRQAMPPVYQPMPPPQYQHMPAQPVYQPPQQSGPVLGSDGKIDFAASLGSPQPQMGMMQYPGQYPQMQTPASLRQGPPQWLNGQMNQHVPQQFGMQLPMQQFPGNGWPGSLI